MEMLKNCSDNLIVQKASNQNLQGLLQTTIEQGLIIIIFQKDRSWITTNNLVYRLHSS